MHSLGQVATPRVVSSQLNRLSRRAPRAERGTSRLVHIEAKNVFSSPGPYTPPDPSSRSSGPGSVSDHEWNLRAGRALYTLRTTLPRFFETGLVSHVDHPSSTSSRSGTSEVHIDNKPSSSKSKAISGPIYAPNIRLCYTPPSSLSLPSPFPKTLQVEGLPLYHASATFIRHTLSAFNTDLHVELRKLHVRSTAPRTREITIHVGVLGKSRISGANNEWDVYSTYNLSPNTALVDLHVVESIHPAPHITFYDGLRAALARLGSVDVGREAGAGIRGCVSEPKLGPIPITEQTEKE